MTRRFATRLPRPRCPPIQRTGLVTGLLVSAVLVLLTLILPLALVLLPLTLVLLALVLLSLTLVLLSVDGRKPRRDA